MSPLTYAAKLKGEIVVKLLIIALVFTLCGCDYCNKLIDGRKTVDVVMLSANGECHEYIWIHDKHYNTSGLAHLPNCSTCQRRKELFEQMTWRRRVLNTADLFCGAGGATTGERHPANAIVDEAREVAE